MLLVLLQQLLCRDNPEKHGIVFEIVHDILHLNALYSAALQSTDVLFFSVSLFGSLDHALLPTAAAASSRLF